MHLICCKLPCFHWGEARSLSVRFGYSAHSGPLIGDGRLGLLTIQSFHAFDWTIAGRGLSLKSRAKRCGCHDVRKFMTPHLALSATASYLGSELRDPRKTARTMSVVRLGDDVASVRSKIGKGESDYRNAWRSGISALT